MIINKIDMPNFSKKEFSEDPDEHAHPTLLKNLQGFRIILGSSIYPSKAPGALARFGDKDSYSDHYAMNKYSQGIDVFCNCSIFKAWNMALNCNLWDSVGVYFDTKLNGEFWPMLHLGIRDMPAMWMRLNKKYYSPHKTADFFAKLHRAFIYYK